jgi:hypothetical protein
MSFAEDGGDDLGLETLPGRNWPTITQFSIFLENRVGRLLEVVRLFQGSKVRIAGLSIVDAADCCIVRMILSHPEQGREILERAKLAFSDSELLVVELPGGSLGLVELCMALLRAELNIHYAYPLILRPHERASMALHIDNVELASSMLRERGFEILSEVDLQN